MYSRLALRSCKAFGRPSISGQALNSHLLRSQHTRGVSILRVTVDSEAKAKRALDRSYKLLVSETVPELGLPEDQRLEQEKAMRWHLIKQKFDFPPATMSIAELEGLEGPPQEAVTLLGYLRDIRVVSSTVFCSFVDFSSQGTLQIISHQPTAREDPAFTVGHKRFGSLKRWTPVAVTGNLLMRQHRWKKIPLTAEPTDTAKSTEEYSQEHSKKPSEESAEKIRKFYLGDMELMLTDFRVLNNVSDDLMFTRDSVFGPNDRHLQLRTDRQLRGALFLRTQIASMCRSELERQGFLEVETPILFKSTPEGAREFLVPTRQKGLMYALPQSPQQYKQILMASGIRRYFQFAKCFRDEDLRADRQPEFTQLDLEMSFAGAKDVMRLIEGLIQRIWNEKRLKWGARVQAPFRRLTYDTAMSNYGTDKPDMRFPHSRIHDVTVLLPHLQNGDPDLVVEAFALQSRRNHAPGFEYLAVAEALFNDVLPRAELKHKQGDQPVIAFLRLANLGLNTELLQRATFDPSEQVQNFLSALNDEIIVIQARPRTARGGSTHLGLIRQALLQEGYLRHFVSRTVYDQIVWVTDFPLFKESSESEPGQGGGSGLSSTHHPFTAPRLEDLPLLETNPLKVKGNHFDLVVNGVELGGGSARIHDAELQKFILKDVMKVPEERLSQFDHLLKVLASGCPPHAGMALGYDRMIALLTGDPMRNVIAFPKNGKGADPLVGSPGPVGDEVLAQYFLKQA